MISKLNFSKPQKIERANKIIKIVDEYFDTKCKSLGKYTPIVLPRQMAMYYIRENLKLPSETIGRLFPSATSRSGFKDHATVLHAHKLISDLVNLDAEIKSYNLDLKDKCKEVCAFSDSDLEKMDLIYHISKEYYKLDLQDLKDIKKQFYKKYLKIA